MILMKIKTILLTCDKSSAQISTGKPGVPSPHLKNEDMNDILQDMESIKGKQDSVDSLLTNMQRENEALWREVAILRQKHHKQQQIVEKLIQFLVTLVQNRGLMGIKRKAQLMIDDNEENRQKLRNKMMKQDDYNQSYSPGNPSSHGPIIHDITDDDIEETIISADSPINAQNICEMSPSQVLVPDTSAVTVNSTNCRPINDTKPIQSLNILDPLRESIKELGLVADLSQEPVATTSSNDSNVNQLLGSSLNTPPGSPSLLTQNNFELKNTNCEPKPNNVTDLVISTQNNGPTASSLSPRFAFHLFIVECIE